MKFTKCLALIAMLAASSTMTAREKQMDVVYMYGMSASFADSTVYFTNVQAVDSAWMDTRTKFLLGRDNYALQLKDMLSRERGEKNRTCIVVFGTKKSSVEKDFLKLRRKYTVKAKGHYDVRYLSDADFRFRTVDMSFETTDPENETPKAKAPKAPKKGKGRPAMPPRQ